MKVGFHSLDFIYKAGFMSYFHQLHTSTSIIYIFVVDAFGILFSKCVLNTYFQNVIGKHFVNSGHDGSHKNACGLISIKCIWNAYGANPFQIHWGKWVWYGFMRIHLKYSCAEVFQMLFVVNAFEMGLCKCIWNAFCVKCTQRTFGESVSNAFGLKKHLNSMRVVMCHTTRAPACATDLWRMSTRKAGRRERWRRWW